MSLKKDQLYAIIAELFDIETSQVSESTSRDDVERWDSMGIIDLVAQIEKKFDVKFDLLEVEELRSVGIIEASLREKGVDLD